VQQQVAVEGQMSNIVYVMRAIKSIEVFHQNEWSEIYEIYCYRCAGMIIIERHVHSQRLYSSDVDAVIGILQLNLR